MQILSTTECKSMGCNFGSTLLQITAPTTANLGHQTYSFTYSTKPKLKTIGLDSTSSLVIRMAALTNNLIRVKIRHPPLLQSPNKTVVRQTDFNVFSKALIINSSEFAKTSSELISTSSELILTIAELISTITETI